MQQLSGRTKGAIVGMGLAVGVLTGGLWVDSTPDHVKVTEASGCSTVFAGRAGSFNTCNRVPDDQVSRNIKRGVGSTVTGCVLGGLAGGVPGFWWGCAGGLASNIPWAGWGD